ncbi:trehalase-like [Aethina tumida]|uniref:trehalase-like n=1 Tax=Aethina tumida TaxID=116153 RepID=UPI002148F118|nr:trehalase-like [Aethina tumida]
MKEVLVMLSLIGAIYLCKSSNESAPSDNSLYNPKLCEIFCHGKILHVVQTSHIFNDDSTFVTMSVKSTVESIKVDFERMMEISYGSPSKEFVKKFVEKHFTKATTTYNLRLDDWIEPPEGANLMEEKIMKDFFLVLHDSWVDCLKMYIDSNITSRIQFSDVMPEAGGNYMEYHYWDTHWIVLGMLAAGKASYVKAILSNFCELIDKYGYVPNGGRIYYVNRTQMPMFARMVYSYVLATNDTTFAEDTMHCLEKEYEFWIRERTGVVFWKGELFTVARYGSDKFLKSPRAESYNHDYNIAEALFQRTVAKENFYQEIRATAESGWLFSSRWIINETGGNDGSLEHLKTSYIAPVDLNAMICGNARILYLLYRVMDNVERMEYYEDELHSWLYTMKHVFWHKSTGSWFDFDILNMQRRPFFYLSNLTPLFAQCYDYKEIDLLINLILVYFYNMRLTSNRGGVPISYTESGFTWDYPFCWDNYIHMLAMGLVTTNNSIAAHMALEIAQNWVKVNLHAYRTKLKFYNTFHAEIPGLPIEAINPGINSKIGALIDLLHVFRNLFAPGDLNSANVTCCSGLLFIFLIMLFRFF